VECLKDQLILQHGLAHAVAARCRRAEADGASARSSLEARVSELEAANAALTRKLQACRAEKASGEEVGAAIAWHGPSWIERPW
jgi:hypothetical protein